MSRIFDHVDLRVADLAVGGPFYRNFLPLLGFVVEVDIPGWIQFEAKGAGATEFFGVTEDRNHRPNASRIAFWTDSREAVDRLAGYLAPMGARDIEGPGDESETYYAVYFNDPCGNRLEICYRAGKFSEI